LASSVVYFIFGIYVARISFFSDTTLFILVPMFIGWGFCQVSMAFFFSCFLNSSQSATLIGYALSTIACFMSSTLLTTSNCFVPGLEEEVLKWWLHLIPTFPYCRIN